jgi:hypothetical protein
MPVLPLPRSVLAERAASQAAEVRSDHHPIIIVQAIRETKKMLKAIK